MTPPTLDLLVLTFNCGKAFIDPAAFSKHFDNALKDGAHDLPDLLVVSLQELAPMSWSFIGGYFINPYFDKFEEAINLAAVHFRDAHHGQTVTVIPTQENNKPFQLVKTHNVGYTGIMLFAKDASKVRELEQAEVGFGAAEMGNKGAVGLRVLYGDAEDEDRCTELTFVATHLAAMEWNLARRNANWATIMRALTFSNPEEIVSKFRELESATPPSPSSSGSSSPNDETTGERRRLLHDEHHSAHLRLQRQLHDISVFKPSSYLFVAGDLNYRIAATSPPPNAPFPDLDPDSENYYPNFFPLDQLTREKNAGRTLHGLSEADIKFPPTYKYITKASSKPDQAKGDEVAEVEWSFASHRYPSWTDRILYLDVPSWAEGSTGRNSKPNTKATSKVEVKAYNAMPPMLTSDHRPVYLRVDVPLISPSKMRPANQIADDIDGGVGNSGAVVDPRMRLPVEIEPQAWERRAAARRKEVVTGWSMFLWSTKQGAMTLGTMLVAGLGAYWVLGAQWAGDGRGA